MTQQNMTSTSQAVGPIKTGYTVRILDEQCMRCGVCSPVSGCAGCVLTSEDVPCGLTNKHTLCVVWDDERFAPYIKKAMRHEAYPVHESAIEKKKGGDDSLTLYECIEKYTAREILGKDDAWHCPGCKKFQQASKQLTLFKCPEILIVHLKRFLQRSAMSREKLGTFVDFPVKGLDLSKHVSHIGDKDSAPIYDLYAISNHMGGIHGGHYTAYAKNPENNLWYCFDDSSCQQVNVNNIKSASAYVLYYKRRS
jgi:ubiquitin carboxyl-terminal hydrolase 4/11/15